MINRLQPLEDSQVQKLHETVMEILARVGVVFHDEEALEIFKRHGFSVDGQKVFFSEEQVMKAIESAPSEFTVQARNPERSVKLGSDHFTVGPCWGASFIIDADGSRREAQMADQEKFCKLVQTSPYVDFAAGSMACPSEINPEHAATMMLAAAFSMTDFPVLSNPCSRENAREVFEMASIVFGGEENVRNKPSTIVSINPLSPLGYTEEAAGGLITYARYGQAMLISSMILAGITGPITLAGTAAMELAESFAGITLAQLINPGVPCICGGTSCAADLRTGGVYLSGPEMLQLAAISGQMAAHYGLPCRYGGNLTDGFSINSQAGIESALGMALPLMSGVHFMHQACGILGAYSAASFEKFVIDEENCGWIKRALAPLEITDESLAIDLIKRVGNGGNYMMTPETAMRCRTAFFPTKVSQRSPYEDWSAKDLGDSVKIAGAIIDERVESYEKPDIDPAIEKDLKAYVDKKIN